MSTCAYYSVIFIFFNSDIICTIILLKLLYNTFVLFVLIVNINTSIDTVADHYIIVSNSGIAVIRCFARIEF